jgi:phage shock protein A
MMDDQEFLSLDLEGAREYLLAYATTVKQYDMDLATLDQDLALWRNRVSLAEGKAEASLAEAARGRVAELEQKRAALAAERAGVASDLVRIKERLPYLKASERSIDPDRLLAELQLMTGELLDPGKAALDREMAATETQAKADDALAELKKKMGGQ